MRFTFAESMCDPSQYPALVQAAEAAGYDSFTVPDSILYPRDSDTQYPYNDDGTLQQVQDAKGNATQYEYNGFGGLKKTTFADGTYIEPSYDSVRRQDSIRTRAGQIISFDSKWNADIAGCILAVHKWFEIKSDKILISGASFIADTAGAAFAEHPRRVVEAHLGPRPADRVAGQGNPVGFEHHENLQIRQLCPIFPFTSIEDLSDGDTVDLVLDGFTVLLSLPLSVVHHGRQRFGG